MRELVLHIGRHKTGTTAIQHFINDNRQALQNAGYYVPKAGKVNAGHHGFSRPLQRRLVRENAIDDPASLPPFRKLQEELVNVDPGLCLAISSEAFQNCDPAVVKQAFEGFSTRIVVYLRNQLEYLASAYAQRVHATDYGEPLNVFFTEVFKSGMDYLTFLSAWESEFPREFVVRRYDRNNTVDDFIRNGLRLDPGSFEKRSEPSNPSLNAKTTEFKRQLNRRELDDKPTTEQMYFVLPRLNELFPSPSMRVSERIASALLERCTPSDAATAQRYFSESRLFDYDSYATGAEVRLSDAEFEEMYAALKDMVSRIAPPPAA